MIVDAGTSPTGFSSQIAVTKSKIKSTSKQNESQHHINQIVIRYSGKSHRVAEQPGKYR